jgi:apolipoprotein N-acyltransferase
MIKKPNYKTNFLDSPSLLLALGFFFNVFCQMRWNVPILAWICLVPFLRYIRLGYSKKWLIPVMFLSLSLSTARIATEPSMLIIAAMSGIQGTLSYLVLFYFWNFIRGKKGEITSHFFVPVFVVTLEWLTSHFSSLGSWGMLANSQLENIPLLQLASITGAYGISFLLAWSNSLLEAIIHAIKSNNFENSLLRRRALPLYLVTMIAVYSFGAYRLFSQNKWTTVRMAAVTTKMELNDVLGNAPGRLKNEKLLFEKTEKAALMGARVVVWNEGGALVYKSEENEFLGKIRSLAARLDSHIVAAYIVQTDPGKILFENKLHWITNEGVSAFTYHKQFIVPSEPSIFIRDTQKVLKTGDGLFSAAICYDFDNMALTHRIAKLNPGIVAIPASDWQGIDPFHSQMAALRAIENGYSIIRSTRAAASAAFDPLGRIRGWLDYYEKHDGIMMAAVPNVAVTTIYKIVGDTFAVMNFIVALAMIALAIIEKKEAS